MKRLLCLVMAIAAVSILTESGASAQGYSSGYLFGSGIGASGGFGFRSRAREQPPYFAQFPPVYYSHIVKRPYGVSPFAVPGGIAPVELGAQLPTPQCVKNPFFGKEVAPVKAPAKVEEKEKTEMKTTWVTNPFKITVAQR